MKNRFLFKAKYFELHETSIKLTWALYGKFSAYIYFANSKLIEAKKRGNYEAFQVSRKSIIHFAEFIIAY